MTEQKQIIVLPKGQLGDRTRKRLLGSGFIPVEVEDTNLVRVLAPQTTVEADEWFWSMAEAIAARENTQTALEFFKRLVTKRNAANGKQ